jgi:hypothetical protein
MVDRFGGQSLILLLVLACAALVACGGDEEPSPSATPFTVTPSPTPEPNDVRAARQALDDLIAATIAGDLPAGWRTYAASIGPGIDNYRQELGCSFDAFSAEFPRMKKMFERLSPLETVQSFPIDGTPNVEIRLRAADGSEYLATLRRVEPGEPYRVLFFNNGNVSRVPGAPDPLPSPDEPQGFCGIWTGGR